MEIRAVELYRPLTPKEKKSLGIRELGKTPFSIVAASPCAPCGYISLLIQRFGICFVWMHDQITTVSAGLLLSLGSIGIFKPDLSKNPLPISVYLGWD